MKSKLEDTSGRGANRAQRSQESYCEVDLEQCSAHPAVVGMRFEYDCEALEQNIAENGQLEPCRAVRDENNLLQLLVYVGQRRLTAVRNLKSKVGTPSTLKVIVDEDGLTDDELVKKALAENVDERGERLSLSDLEKISYTRGLLKTFDPQRTERILVNAGFERSSAKKIVSLVGKLESEQIGKLHRIETKSNFRFRVAHLDMLLESENLQNFYETAAVAAFSQKPPEEVKALRLCSGYFSKDIPWFYEIFPELAVQRAEPSRENVEANLESDLSPEEAKTSIEKSEFGEFALESVIVVNCHYCSFPNLFRLKTGSPEFVFCNLKEDGLIEKSTMVANSVFDCERECSSCQKNFWITTSQLDGRVVIETSASRIVKFPRNEAIISKIYWDKAGGWMLYDEVSKKKSKLGDAENSRTSMVHRVKQKSNLGE